jgi:hypothetical protein
MSFQAWDGVPVGPPPGKQAAGLFTFDLRTGVVTQIRPFTADETVKAPDRLGPVARARWAWWASRSLAPRFA